MLQDYFYNETQMRSVGGQGPSQSTIQAVHQAIQAQLQALQAQQEMQVQQEMQTQQSMQPYYHSLQYYYPMYIPQYRIPFSIWSYETIYYL
ncbi:hypothetical protein FNE59_04350 [Bacillus thuringiensis]|nr:hypothetical protein [Bacillus thuringiensis]MRC87712.1 hypothetical protein [Bacillus thuringiensis]